MLPDARLIYMVRDPIDRMLSHYLHNVGGGYDDRPLADALADPRAPTSTAAATRSSSSPTSRRSASERIEIVAREELKRDRPGTMRRVFEFLGVDAGFTSQQFEREWETGTAKGGGRFRLMDRAVRLPGLARSDRNFDRLPESLRWLVERVVHDPGAGEAPKPEVPPRCASGSRGCSAPTSRGSRGRRPRASAGSTSHPGRGPVPKLWACEWRSRRTSGSGIAEAIVEELRRRGHEPIPHGALSDAERDDWAWASEAAARDVAEGRAEQAIVCCWTGTGASIAANKVPGMRAALCGDAQTAAGARRWNDANVLALSLRATSEAELGEILDAWFDVRAERRRRRSRQRRAPRRDRGR